MKDVGFDTAGIPNFLRKDKDAVRYADTRTSAERKVQPVWSGCFQYFPDALVAVAELSKAGNDKHNPGEPLHWSREKSSDHADCAGRHLIDLGPDWTDVDHEDGLLHAQKLAWRSLALLQIAIERRRAKQRPVSGFGPIVGASQLYAKSENTAAAPLTPTPEAWIKWDGGRCPVAPDAFVEVKLRDGSVQSGAHAFDYRWGHRHPESDHHRFDIIAYRIVKA